MDITIRERISIYCLMLVIKIIKPSEYSHNFSEREDAVREELQTKII